MQSVFLLKHHDEQYCSLSLSDELNEVNRTIIFVEKARHSGPTFRRRRRRRLQIFTL